MFARTEPGTGPKLASKFLLRTPYYDLASASSTSGEEEFRLSIE